MERKMERGEVRGSDQLDGHIALRDYLSVCIWVNELN